MNSEDQQLITRVFDEIGNWPLPNKDPDAARLIHACVERLPDAPYRLVQSVIIQQREMRRLEQRVRDLEWTTRLSSPGHESASFLAPATSPTASGAVPPVAPRYEEQARDERPRDPPPLPSSPPNFLASALTTATGFAGGMLLTDGLRKLFSGGESSSGAGEVASGNRYRDELMDARNDAATARSQLADDDAALDDAQVALDAQNENALDFGEA